MSPRYDTGNCFRAPFLEGGASRTSYNPSTADLPIDIVVQVNRERGIVDDGLIVNITSSSGAPGSLTPLVGDDRGIYRAQYRFPSFTSAKTDTIVISCPLCVEGGDRVAIAITMAPAVPDPSQPPNPPTPVDPPPIDTNDPKKPVIDPPVFTSESGVKNGRVPAVDMQNGSNTCFPIIPATAEKQLYETDWQDLGRHPLTLQRTYRSQVTHTFAGLTGLAAHWHLSPVASLRIDAAGLEAKISLGNGGVRRFTRSSASAAWQPGGVGVDTLTADLATRGWRYSSGEDDSVYAFSDGGLLTSQTQRNGWVMRYTYTPLGAATGTTGSTGSASAWQLSQVTNAFNRSMNLAYNGAGQLIQLSFPDGQVIAYGYDAQQRLTTVRYPGGATKTYLYENLSFPGALTGVTDEQGSRLSTYTYDAQGRAIETTKANGVDRYKVAYTGASSAAPGNAATINAAQVTDPLGTTRNYTYGTTNGKLAVASASLPGGAGGYDAASRTQDAYGFITEENDFLGVRTQYTWDAARGLLVAKTAASNRPEAQTIQTQWHPTLRLPTTVTEQGRTIAYTYDAVGNKLSEAVSGTGIDRARVTTYAYNAQGLIESITDPKAAVTRFFYDASGNLTSIRNALGQEARYSYDAAGRLTQETAANGLVSAYSYDPRGRLSAAAVGGEVISVAYNPTGQPVSAQLPNGYRVQYSYDVSQRLTGASDNRGNSVSYQLDNAGNRIRQEVRDGSGQIALLTSRVISQLNRVQAIQGASGQTTQIGYDANAQAISQTDPLNQTTRQTLDGLSRPTATTFADNTSANQAWNQLNQLTQVTDPKGVATQYQLNAFGEVIAESGPDTGATSYQRDSNGYVIASQDARGNTTQITRDALGRPLQVVRTNPAGTGTAASQTTRYTWDAPQVGYLSQIEDNTGSSTYERDTQGRILSKTQTTGSGSRASSLTTRYSYANGDLASITYPSGLKVTYNRNNTGQITGISTQEPSTNPRRPAPITAFASGISYTALGQPKAWTWSSGDTASRAFDADGRMTSSEFASYTFDAASRISSISQSLWASRTVTSVVGTGTAIINELYRTPLAWTASYDSRDRLTGFKRDGSDTRYSYDPNSNRVSAIEATTSDTDLDGLFDADDFTQTSSQSTSIDPASNKLLGFTQTLTKVKGTKTLATTNANVSYQLDAAGNLTSDGLRTFEYDPANRLAKLKVLNNGEASSIAYLHNSQGQRVFKGEPVAEQTLPNQAVLGEDFITYLKRQFGWLFTAAQSNASIGTAFTYADGQLPEWALLGEYDNGSASGKGRTEYLWLPTEDGSAVPVGLYRNGKFFAVHADHLGTPRLITNEQNQPVWQWPYSAFGNNKPTGILKATPNPRAAITNQPVLLRATTPAALVDLRFPGQHADDEAGVFYNYQRNYQASQGRYTQNDPIGLAGGLNRTAYVEGNPVSLSDPEGLRPPGFGSPYGRPTYTPSTREVGRSGGTLPPGPPSMSTNTAARDLLRDLGNAPTALETNLPGEFSGINYIPQTTPIVLPPRGANGCTVIKRPTRQNQCPAEPLLEIYCGPTIGPRP